MNADMERSAVMNYSKNYIFSRTKSSAVKEILYDVAWARLYVTLKGDRLYCYYDVPMQEVMELLSAPSIGHYFATNIVQYQYSALRQNDSSYAEAMSSAITEESMHTSMPKSTLVRREMPFFFGPLPNRELYPTLVDKAQSTFREVIKNYGCPLDVASSAALNSHNALIPFLPDNSVNYVLHVLQTLNIIITVVNPRKSKYGDCRLDSKRRIAYITVNENINKYKFLCILMHEVSHALNHLRYSAHDEIWKCIYACLLADCYLYFPEKYQKELQWMMVHTPATTRSTNFDGVGILSGCSCDIPNCFQNDSTDREAEKKDYPAMLQKYAQNAFIADAMISEEDDIYGNDEIRLLNHCAGKLARASIRKAIENCADILSTELLNVQRIVKCHFGEDCKRHKWVVLRLSDMLVRCWVQYNPLSVIHAGSFKQCYRSGNLWMDGNPWIDELIKLILLK